MAVMAEKLNPKIKESLIVDADELAQRVAVLKRFKTLLTQQRDRFKNYLNLLEKQQSVIETGSAEDLLNYVEIEEKIVADIFSIQKVIDPLEEMYYSVIGSRNTQKPDTSEEVPPLKESLEKLKSETVVRSKKNRELLSKRMLELRSEIKALRNNPYASSSRRPNFNDANTASLIDIKG
jgi:DNA-binding transcriptional regulator GbsR (MarR family)